MVSIILYYTYSSDHESTASGKVLHTIILYIYIYIRNTLMLTLRLAEEHIPHDDLLTEYPSNYVIQTSTAGIYVYTKTQKWNIHDFM